MREAEIHAVHAPQRVRTRDNDRAAATVDPADWLYLAAAPTFAIMALLTAVDGSAMDRLCLAGSSTPLSGMLPMYLFMTAFHSAPWLKLITRKRRASSTL